MSRNQKRDKQRFLDAFEENPMPSHVAKKLGVPRSTYYRWLKEDKDFKAVVEEKQTIGREKFVDIAESRLLEKMNEGDMQAIRFFLAHNSRRYYSPTIKLIIDQHTKEINLKDEQIEQLKEEVSSFFSRLSTDELRRLARLNGLSE